jgi:hypothetical protein
MKKLVLVVLLLAGLKSFVNAQITKADFEMQLKFNETNMDKITTLYIGNTKAFFTNGSWTRSDLTYKRENEEYTNEFILADNGLLIKSYKNGEKNSTNFIPFYSIIRAYVAADKINIYLRE